MMISWCTRVLKPLATGALLVAVSAFGVRDANADWSGSFNPTTTFTLGQITIAVGGTPDITGDYTLTGAAGSSVDLSVVQSETGQLVGTATVNANGATYGPFPVGGRIKPSCRIARFCLGGQFEEDLGLCDEDDDDDDDEDEDRFAARHWSGHDDDDDDDDEDEEECDDEVEVSVKVRGYLVGSEFVVRACLSVEAPEGDAREKLTGSIVPASIGTTSTIVIADAQSFSDDDDWWAVEYDSERDVTVDGVSLGLAEAEQENCRSFVRFEADIDEDDDSEFEANLYGMVINGVFTPALARVEIDGVRRCVPAANITVTPSAFTPIESPDDDDDEDDDDDD